MRSKAPLALLEQTIMVLVFALAAALCLRAFLWSDAASARNQARDQAVLQAESAAEVLKHSAGDFEEAARTLGGRWDGAAWTIYYDGDWQEASAPAAYTLTALPQDSGHSLLGLARVEVRSGEDPLFNLTVCWQEVEL